MGGDDMTAVIPSAEDGWYVRVMTITAETQVAAIAVADPATIRVFQQHHIDFCCGGKIPLSEACSRQGLDPDALIEELRAVGAIPTAEPRWETEPMGSLIAHIQARFHRPLRDELPRLQAMLDKVVSRHGNHLPDTLPRLAAIFDGLQAELLSHMAREDAVLFPAIIASEAALAFDGNPWQPWLAIEGPVPVMEAEHESAGAALAAMRDLTGGYAAPDWACPTFRGLYHGLAQLEADMHVHVHLENHVLFPRAVSLAQALAARAERPQRAF
jgi:regulator of cell morphogenesis and NO signaling